ncbi:MAG: hypothetical protein HY870_19135 [Chloroflexi bacterium]|nr:hypothetical protein [Chloroflexota bacterium]
MIKQSLVAGLITGLLTSLGLIYPTLVLVVFRENPAGFGATDINRTSAVSLVLSGVVLIVAVLLTGIYPALRLKATSWRVGSQAGLLSGLLAAVVVFLVVVSPANAWQATVPLFSFPARLDGTPPPDSYVNIFLQRIFVYSFVRVLPILLIAGGVIGWLTGGLVGALRREERQPEPVLIDLIDERRGARKWFGRNDDTARAGLIAGVLCGGLIVLASLSTAASDLAAQAPRLGLLVRNALSGVPGAEPFINNSLSNSLSPFVVITLLGFGGLAVLLVHDPARRYGSRIGAATIAGGFMGLAVLFNIQRVINLTIGLGRYVDFGLIPAESLADILPWFSSPIVIAGMFFLAPLGMALLVVGALMTGGAAQGILYGVFASIVMRRPVDRAAAVRLQLREAPDQFLPQLYALYNTRADAARILPHLAFDLRRRQPDMAHVIAAHHVASTDDERAVEAVPVIHAALKTQTQWRWQAELGALYRVLDAGLRARTVEQIADIEPLPEAQTSSLPPTLSRTSEAVTRVLIELRKLERVDDVNSKLIFLNNSLDAIRAGKRHSDAMRSGHLPPQEDWAPVAEIWRNDPQLQAVNLKFKAIKDVNDLMPALRELGKVDWRRNIDATIRRSKEIDRPANRSFATAAPYPEAATLRQMLDQWQSLVMERVKDLQGRAALVSTIKTRQLSFAPNLAVTLTVNNSGLNIAEQVRLRLADGEGYRVLDGGEQAIDLLTAGSARDLDVTIEPLTRDRVRLQWQIIYDDAVDDDRTVEFADVIELAADTQRPFVRIFPIPYVTGMPLKTDHLFVGRADVFAYIQEHLFGAYQNNVIVLHGQRRTGKTSILYRLKKVLADTHICVLVDMQGKAARGTLDFLYSLADDIAYALDDQDIAVSLPARSDFAESPEFVFRSRFLRSVAEALPVGANGQPKHLLLMFDEFEELQKRVQDGKLEPEIFPFLRNLMQHEECLDFVFAGTHKLEELGAEYWSILFNIASYKKITFLTPDDARRLITEPVAPHLEYDPLAIERITAVSGGHPYFTQVICHELVAFHNETQRSYITANEVEDVLDRIVERGEAHFKFIWAEASPIERSVLLALADLLETDETVGVDPVQALLDKRAINLNGTPLIKVLDDLEMGDILTRSGPRSNLYRFKIDLIRRWIYATRPN